MSLCQFQICSIQRINDIKDLNSNKLLFKNKNKSLQIRPIAFNNNTQCHFGYFKFLSLIKITNIDNTLYMKIRIKYMPHFSNKYFAK